MEFLYRSVRYENRFDYYNSTEQIDESRVSNKISAYQSINIFHCNGNAVTIYLLHQHFTFWFSMEITMNVGTQEENHLLVNSHKTLEKSADNWSIAQFNYAFIVLIAYNVITLVCTVQERPVKRNNTARFPNKLDFKADYTRRANLFPTAISKQSLRAG